MHNGDDAQLGTAAIEVEENLFERLVDATRHTDRSRALQLIETLVEQAVYGEVSWNGDVERSIRAAIKSIDERLSTQLAEVIHHPAFQKLEGTWRGLSYLTTRSQTGAMIKIRVLNVSKRELFRDLRLAVEFDRSELFGKLHAHEYGTAGGEPFGALIGDYEFANRSEDMDLLGWLSSVAAEAFCPFISAAAPEMFGFEDWRELSLPRDLEKIFRSVDYTKWKSLRNSEDARFLVLVLPRVLARLPYTVSAKQIEEGAFGYTEVDASKPALHDEFTWMSAAYVLGATMTAAFDEHGTCAMDQSMQSRRVRGLPEFCFMTDDGDMDQICPTEKVIFDRRRNELRRLGFLPLCHYKNSDSAVFFGAQTVHRPLLYDRPEATANAAISARLPYIMATSRFACYLKVIARDLFGSFKDASDVERELNRWINNYVSMDPDAEYATRLKYPLREAKVLIQEVFGRPGSFSAFAWIRPWLAGEELTAAMRLVASIP